MWELAEAGWRAVLARHKDESLRRTVGKLNTPRPKQVDELFADLLGIASFSSGWLWHSTSNAKVKQSLEDLVTLRGEIGHRVVASRPVQKADVVQAAKLVQRLAVVSSNTVRKFLMTRVSEEPWSRYEIGGVS